MKTPTMYANSITENDFDIFDRIRIKSSYGCFTIEMKTIKGKRYAYFYKKFDKKLFKIYIGSVETIKQELFKNGGLLHKKSIELESRIQKYFHDRHPTVNIYIQMTNNTRNK